MIDDVIKGIFSKPNGLGPDSHDRCHDDCGACTGGCHCQSNPENSDSSVTYVSHSGTETWMH